MMHVIGFRFPADGQDTRSLVGTQHAEAAQGHRRRCCGVNDVRSALVSDMYCDRNGRPIRIPRNARPPNAIFMGLARVKHRLRSEAEREDDDGQK